MLIVSVDTPGASLLQAPRRLITEGAFKDRLGFPLVTAIAASSHPFCIGLREMMNNREHIDLDRPDLPQLLGLLVANGLPVALAGLAGSGPLTAEKVAAVLEAPVQDVERPGAA